MRRRGRRTSLCEWLISLSVQATPGDGQALARAWRDIGRYYADLDPERFNVPDEDSLAESFEQRRTRPPPENWFIRVAALNGDVVGMVSATIEEPLDSAQHQLLRELGCRRLTVRALGVRTQFWRQRIGRQLLETTEAWGRSRGARVVQLDTAVNSPVSVPCYEQRMGYVRQSLILRKPLLPS